MKNVEKNLLVLGLIAEFIDPYDGDGLKELIEDYDAENAIKLFENYFKDDKYLEKAIKELANDCYKSVRKKIKST